VAVGYQREDTIAFS